MPPVPGLRSPYAKVGRLVYFGRMLDKIRLQAAGQLPEIYAENMGDSIPLMFDTRCCTFLRVPYSQIKAWTLGQASDEAVLQLAEADGGRRSDEECEIWNGFLMKRGWHCHPNNVANLQRQIAEGGLTDKGIQTWFDYIDFEEGRDPFADRAWEKI